MAAMTMSVWDTFILKLKENNSTFEELDVDTNWKTLLYFLKFDTLDSGKLLKIIKEKKPPNGIYNSCLCYYIINIYSVPFLL